MDQSETGPWMSLLRERLMETFGDRIIFIGLQGSRARGEATENSDVDAVVILDRVSHEDVVSYRCILDSMPYRELACGFLSGVGELSGWMAGDLFQFRHDTIPISGSLDAVLPPEGIGDAAEAALAGACTIYHMCVHNMVHERSSEILDGLSKQCRFTLSAAVFARTGAYYGSISDLREAAGEESRILDLRDSVQGAEWDSRMDGISSEIIEWTSSLISEFGSDRRTGISTCQSSSARPSCPSRTRCRTSRRTSCRPARPGGTAGPRSGWGSCAGTCT
ncbi:nucleotidyltransferase domain-containing protein [Methanomassiliicoccaceae archaeon DOK]|nr:nucleotidyltransferase domain-containing protein [Methanomassiliicoccaceae archaeon DOK]